MIRHSRQISHHARPTAVGVLVVALTTILYVGAVSRGVTTIDVARDLYWANEIAMGRTFPLAGPPIGGMDVLGPVWFYVAALAALLTTSLTGYFGCLVLFAASKFALAYSVGLKWRDSALAVALVAASAVPGIASYQLFGVSHPQMLEAMVWACAWFVLRYRRRQRIRDAAWAGVFAACALHAHPTAIFLLPWMCLGLAWIVTTDGNGTGQRAPARWLSIVRAGTSSLLAGTAVFAPRFFSAHDPLPSVNPSDALAHVPTVAELLSSASAYAANMSWVQAKYVMQSVRPQSESLATVIMEILALVTTIGCFAALRSRTLCIPLLAAAGTWFLCAIGVASLRSHTPFYMLYVALPPFVAALAIAWRGLCTIPAGTALFATAVVSAVTLQVFVSIGVYRLDKHMPFESHLPTHSNMKGTSTESHLESFVSAPTRDEVARWLCMQPRGIALHGDLAAALDVSFQIEVVRACGAQSRLAQLGGPMPAWVGLPLKVLHVAGVTPAFVTGAYGLSPAVAVLSPASGLRPSAGDVYPPRLEAILNAGEPMNWQVEIKTAANSALVVSSLLPVPGLSEAVVANGLPLMALTAYSGTRIYACDACGTEPVAWQVTVNRGSREFTSVTILARAANLRAR